MTLGQNLSRLRIESKMGQKELALRLNVSIGTVSNYENDVHSPTPETLGKLADCFGVSVDYLLGRTQFRYDIQQLERHISSEYTVIDFVNMVISFDSGTADNLMAYVQFLQARQQEKDV